MNANDLKTNKLTTGRTARRAIKSLLVTSCAITFFANSGCQWVRKLTGQSDTTADAKSLPTTLPATTQLVDQSVTPVPPGLETTNRPVVQGPLPLFYLVEGDGMLRVRNVETNEEIITFEVKAMQIVRVETKGVMLANKPVIGANLVPGNYAIEIVNPDSNAVHSTQKRGVIQSQ